MNTLFLKAGIHPMVPPPKALPVGGGCLDVRPHIKAVAGRSTSDSNLLLEKKLDQKLHVKLLPWGFSFSFPYPFRYLWNGGGKNKYGSVALDDVVLADENMEENEGRNENWILKIFHLKSLWKGRNNGGEILDQDENGDDQGSREAFCEGCSSIDDEKGDKIEFDRDSFSKLLKRVSLEEARLYAHLSFLGDLAYSIPQIKPKNLLASHGLHYVTSSFEKKEQASKARKEKELAEQHQSEEGKISAGEEGLQRNRIKRADKSSAAAAYEIVASAASYLHTHTKSILPFSSSKSTRNKDLPEREKMSISTGEMASLMATTDSVTSVVSAKEEVKQAVADDLNSTRSSPCEWFVCDEDKGATRYFVIKGSDSLASWQANLLFEPIKFEGLDVLVHRGIYEAAKGIYKQVLPEVRAYLKVHGSRATFRFTGHSRGGSLSLLLNLMLLIRGEVPASSLLPVITFGAPAVMCGGNYLLHKLGLPRGHLQSITMHRDIVPRAFSCNYPNHVAELLKAVNRNFRNHPCLNKQKLLYAPMGEFLILQPDEKISPHHELIPSGSGLYLLSCPVQDVKEAEKQIRAAQNVFLNSPHPLEILRLRSSYGSNGSIKRDHHMTSYLRSIRNVICQELKYIRKVKREKRHKLWWPLVAPSGDGSSTIMGRPVLSGNINQVQFNLYGTLQNGKETLKRFSRLVASQHMQLLVVLLFPAKLLIVGIYSFIKFP